MLPFSDNQNHMHIIEQQMCSWNHVYGGMLSYV